MGVSAAAAVMSMKLLSRWMAEILAKLPASFTFSVFALMWSSQSGRSPFSPKSIRETKVT
ncbi:MAG: hypothetical protein RLZ70_2045 [Verrucomicrobiota bacterium]